jgi:hypothetical protein
MPTISSSESDEELAGANTGTAKGLWAFGAGFRTNSDGGFFRCRLGLSRLCANSVISCKGLRRGIIPQVLNVRVSDRSQKVIAQTLKRSDIRGDSQGAMATDSAI